MGIEAVVACTVTLRTNDQMRRKQWKSNSSGMLDTPVKVGDGIKALADLPKSEREEYRETLAETYCLDSLDISEKGVQKDE